MSERPEDRAKALELGAIDYLIKSELSLEEMVKRVLSHLA